jgi:ATP-dependent helicase/nuclease subunit A
MIPDPLAGLTEQQRRAVVTRDVSVVLSSGAGCGKTHVLTQRYLSHLRDDGAEVGQIVAITFTDRAARQMRDRIRGAVLAHVRAAATDAEAERWAGHFRALETAQISTIHAFCATLLRQHAVEAGLDPRFDVLEDVLSVNLEMEALTACLQRLLPSETGVGDDLRELVLLYGWPAVVEAVQHLLRGWDELPWRDWLDRPAEQVAEEWRQRTRSELLPRYVDYLLIASPKIARCLDLLRRKPPVPGSPLAANVQRLLEGMPRLGEAPDLAAAVEELTEAAKVGRKGPQSWPDPDDYKAVQAALKDFRDELRAQKLEAFAAPVEGLTDAVVAGQRFLRVAREAALAYRERKGQHGVVDFQDLLLMARDLLRDNAEVRARLQDRYRFLLIDELQDTDPVQMQLVESLSGAGLTAGKLFAVGDHKQSIYRFRGANVHLFRGLRNQVPHDGRQGLTVNFRSQPAILDFANALLGRAMEAYEPLHPHHRQLNAGPCVEFLWSPRYDRENATESRRREAEWIARRIAAMIDREALVAERTDGGERLRPVRRGDVVLLFRAMSNVHLYEAALRNHGLDYYLVGGRAFFAQQEIYDLLNLLRALENPQDAVCLAGTLRSPFCCLSDEALYVLGRCRGGLWGGLHDDATFARLPENQRPTAERARRHLGAWRGVKDRLPIAALLGRVFDDSGYDAATQFEFLGDRKLANLWKLTDLARTFDRSGLFGLAEFIARLADLVKAQPREEQAATQPESADVVRLMTIHQAKGLEFPVVFVPDVAAAGRDARHPAAVWSGPLGCVARPPADDDPPPFPDLGWRLWRAGETVEDYHEDLRALYVACTRAQDYLVLSAALERPFRPANAWMTTLARRFDLESGACLDAEVPREQRPQARVVTDVQALPPLPKSINTARLNSGRGRSGQASRVSPVPVSLRGKRVFRLAELEPFLRPGAAPPAPWPEDMAYQFDAEDGSDRHDWARRRDFLSPRPEEDGLRGRILRAVLARWDFRRPDGWQALLADEYRALGEEASEEWLRTLNRPLARFAESPLRSRLAAAAECHREVEFLTDGLPEGAAPVGLHGLVDCLWREGTDDWHLLTWVTARAGTDAADPSWGGRKPGLLLTAWAVHQCLGVWPRSSTLYWLERGDALVCRGQELRRCHPLKAAVRRFLEVAQAE